jgi:hypothetical protein
MPQHLKYKIHTHIHHLAPTVMTSSRPTAASNASTATELESLVALVARLSVVSMDAVRLAAEVQGMFFLPCFSPAPLKCGMQPGYPLLSRLKSCTPVHPPLPPPLPPLR